MKHSTLADMIADKPVHKTSPDDTVRTACIIMSSANIGALPVVDDNGDLVGILSERDVIRRSIIVYHPSDETARRLPSCELIVSLHEPSGPPAAKRITASMRWLNRQGQFVAPVRLVTWIYGSAEEAQQ